MITFEDFISETNKASSPEAVFSIFEQALQSLGYDRFCYSLITDHTSLNLKAGHGVMRNYDEDWMNHYAQNEYEKIDPVPKYCFATDKPFTWDWVTKNLELSTQEQTVMNEAHEAKLLDGVAVPMYGINGELAGVGMASSSGNIEMNQDLLCKIRALCFQFHLAYTDKRKTCLQNETTRIILTEREKEVLLWMAEGKSMPDIGDIIGISYATVRFHVGNLFKKLDANERVYAVIKALRMGLINPSYVSQETIPSRVAR